MDGVPLNQSQLGYAFESDVTSLLPDIPANTIVSRTFFDDKGSKGIVFGFAEGQELSEHTASRPAILHFISGKAQLTLGEDSYDAGPGSWVYMDARLPHSVVAETPVIMLLLMLP